MAGLGQLRSLGTRRRGKPGQENSDVMDTKGGLSGARFRHRLGWRPWREIVAPRRRAFRVETM